MGSASVHSLSVDRTEVMSVSLPGQTSRPFWPGMLYSSDRHSYYAPTPSFGWVSQHMRVHVVQEQQALAVRRSST